MRFVLRCRHKVFAEYFGEEVPRCDARCDVCADERNVRRALEQHQRRAASAQLRSGGLVVHQDSADLYGEGRQGQKKLLPFHDHSCPYHVTTHYSSDILVL